MGHEVTATLVIEPMAGRHIDAVRAIDEQCYSRPWSAATWRSELAAPDRHHVIGRIDERLVAHAGSLLVVDELHITTVAVDPACEGRGHATRLCLELLAAGRTAGATAATLEVRAAARRTQRLYARLGFAPAGVRAGYYDHPTDDAVIMWLDDLSRPETQQRLDRLADELDRAVGPNQGAIR